MLIMLRRDALDRVARDEGWTKTTIAGKETLNQRALAEALGFHESHVARILAGDRPVSDGFAFRLMKVTGCSLDELFVEVREELAEELRRKQLAS